MATPGHGSFGDMLPGRGLYLNHDLKDLGITRGDIPHVYERTQVKKISEALLSERNALKLIAYRDYALRGGHVAADVARAAITTYDGIIAARAGGFANDVYMAKASITSVGSIWYSLMLAAAGTIAPLSGLAAGSGSANAGGTACTRATAGAWSLGINNPTGSNRKYLLTIGFNSVQQINQLALVDLLVGVSALSTNSATNNVNTVALPRYGAAGSIIVNGAGVWPVLECTTPPSPGALNWGGTYTNQAGAGANFVATAMVNAQVASRIQSNATGMWMCPSLAVGDYGVQGVLTITTSAQFASGVFNLYLVYPLTMLPALASGLYYERDSTIQIDSICELANASQVIGCLGGFVLPNTTSTGISQFFFRTCEG
jgi:hypothetical protein